MKGNVMLPLKVKRRTNLGLILLLSLATLSTYCNSIFNGFVWDDNDIIINNVLNRDVSNIVTIFQSPDSTKLGNQKSYYRPLNRLTYMIDYQVFGLRAFGYHLENIILHLLTVFLFYFLGLFLFAETMPAFFAALMFAVHPVNSEAVNFISTRNTILAAFFVLSSFLFYIQAKTVHKKKYYRVSWLLFFMGLLSKETALMLLPVLFLYDISSFSNLRERFREKMVSLVPFIAGTIIYLFMRSHALSGFIGTALDVRGLWQRLLQNLYVIPKYLSVIVFPLKLNALYAIPDHYLGDRLWLITAWSVILAALFFLLRARRNVTRFGILWFALNFIPISGVVPIPSAPMAERYLYLPAMGFWLIVADQFYALYKKNTFRKILIVFAAVVTVGLIGITFARNYVWKDSISFYSSMVKTNPNSTLAHYSLGLAYMENDNVLKAQSEWKRTAEINPNYFNVLMLLGQSYLMVNAPDEAEHYYALALLADTDNTDAIYNLALVKEKLGKKSEALAYFEMFLENHKLQNSLFVSRAREKVRRLKEELGLGK